MPAEIFEHANFSGRKQTLYPGFYNIDQLAFGNDMISSLKTYDTRVTLIEHHNGVGARWSFMGNVPYVGNDWNDKTSSILVEGGFPPLGVPSLTGQAPQVIIFEHKDYQGGYKILKPGSYNSYQIALKNNPFSSIMLFGNCRAILHMQHFGPPSMTLAQDMSYLGDYWNDRISSIEVIAPYSPTPQNSSVDLNLQLDMGERKALYIYQVVRIKMSQMAASENNIGLPSDAALDAMLAQMVRDIALGLPNDELSKPTLKIAKTAYKKALKDMISAWDYGDDICPPFWLSHQIAPWPSIVSGDPQPQPWRVSLADLNPQPLPPRSKTTIKVQTAELLAQAATLTTDEIFSKTLIDVAIELYRNSVGEKYSDDFVEWCGTIGSRRPIVVPPPPPPINVLGDLPIG